jgi:hypothetical protein
VICADNDFTGSKRNIDSMIGHHRFELLRHDVTFDSLFRGRPEPQSRLPASSRARPGADARPADINDRDTKRRGAVIRRLVTKHIRPTIQG